MKQRPLARKSDRIGLRRRAPTHYPMLQSQIAMTFRLMPPRPAIRRRSETIRLRVCQPRPRSPDLYEGMTLGFSRPSKPTDTAFIEAFNGRRRAGALNTHWFMTLVYARDRLEDWRKCYNEDQPHGAIGNTPWVSIMTPVGAPRPLT